jgi:hypothetical protein
MIGVGAGPGFRDKNKLRLAGRCPCASCRSRAAGNLTWAVFSGLRGIKVPRRKRRDEAGALTILKRGKAERGSKQVPLRALGPGSG